MKKLFLSLTLVIASSLTFAQEIQTPATSASVGDSPVQQGNWIVGGSIGSLGYSFEGENFNININPQAGYFIADGFAVGLKAGFGLQTVKGGDNIYQYRLMPFGRYYFSEGAKSTGRFFGQGEVGVTGAESGGVSDTSFGFGVNAGYAHFLSRNVALEGTVGYNYSKSNLANSQAQNGLGLAVGFQIYL